MADTHLDYLDALDELVERLPAHLAVSIRLDPSEFDHPAAWISHTGGKITGADDFLAIDEWARSHDAALETQDAPRGPGTVRVIYLTPAWSVRVDVAITSLLRR